MWGKINDTIDRLVRLDSATHAVKTIEFEHSEIHGGHSFYVDYVNSTMTDTNTITILIITADSTKHAHIVVGAGATGECTLEFYENTTTTDNGTVLSIHNRERNNGNAAVVSIYHTPSVSNNGILLQTKFLGSAGKFSSEGGQERNANEWILKVNTKYLLKLIAHATVKGRIFANWYELIGKGDGI